MTSADFQAMIPSHFISGGAGGRQMVQVDKSGGGQVPHQDTVTVTVQKAVPDMPMLPPAPTELGTVTETITKSTFTETVMTRVTDNRLLEPLISEVNTVYCFTLPISLFHTTTTSTTTHTLLFWLFYRSALPAHSGRSFLPVIW